MMKYMGRNLISAKIREGRKESAGWLLPIPGLETMNLKLWRIQRSM